MFTRLDYSSVLEYSIIRRYTNIVYYYYYSFGITVLHRLPYGDILGLYPYGWDLIFNEAFVEHWQQPPMGFGTDIH